MGHTSSKSALRNHEKRPQLPVLVRACSGPWWPVSVGIDLSPAYRLGVQLGSTATKHAAKRRQPVVAVDAFVNRFGDFAGITDALTDRDRNDEDE
jgi:hypothetical protein